MSDAERLMQWFDRQPEEERGEIIHLVEFLAKKADPVAWSMDHAPEDDEPLTAKEISAIEAARASIARDGTLAQAQVEAELGI